MLVLVVAGGGAAGSWWIVTSSQSPSDVAPPAAAEAAGTPSADPSPSQPDVSPPPPPPRPLPGPPVPRAITAGTTAVHTGAYATSDAARAFFETAPTVVVVDGSARSMEVGAWLAARHGTPMLVEGPDLDETLGSLGTVTVVAVGDVGDVGGLTVDDVRRVVLAPPRPAGSDPQAGDDVAGAALAGRWGWHRLAAFARGDRPAVGVDVSSLGTIGRLWEPASDAATVLVPGQDVTSLPAAITAMAAGHRVVPLATLDPRGDPNVRHHLADVDLSRLVLLGPEPHWTGHDPHVLRWQLQVAASGQELPGGGQLLFPGRRLVALYGTPGSGALGVLGEQPVEAAVDRAIAQARAYDAYSDEPVLPTFEIIATIASASAGPDGDYSTERSVEDLRPWVDAAEDAGLYVVLDLQPGRSDFLTQARQYEELLVRPHVGLALDPEWRLGPAQRHLVQVGGVDAAEVNAVSDWLASLVREHRLPQKLLIVHQFKLSMIRDRTAVVSRPELATLIQMDGQGGQPVKLATWNAIRRDPPSGVWWGWKNFHDEDSPMRTPAETMTLDPQPVFISYQ